MRQVLRWLLFFPDKKKIRRLVSFCYIILKYSILDKSDIAYIFALSEKWKLGEKYFIDEASIALMEIYNSLVNLAHELKSRSHFLEENVSLDGPFYPIRMTWLLSLMSILGLWNKINNIEDNEINDFIKDFCLRIIKQTTLWGEVSIPQYLSFYWYYRFVTATIEPEMLLHQLIEILSQRNNPRSNNPLPDLYYEANDLLPYFIDMQIDKFLPHKYRMSEEPLHESFGGDSSTLEGLIYLYVRCNWKQEMKLLWPQISKIGFRSFNFKQSWHYYLWHVESGEEQVRFPSSIQSWKELKKISNESCDAALPQLIKKYPAYLILFICVFPHRFNASAVRWIDSTLRAIR